MKLRLGHDIKGKQMANDPDKKSVILPTCVKLDISRHLKSVPGTADLSIHRN